VSPLEFCSSRASKLTHLVPSSATTSLFTPLDLTTALPSIPVELINSQSPHIVRLDLTLSRLSSLIATSIDPFVSLDRATAIDELAVLVITTSKALKAESKPGEEEGREQRFKSLATRKRRAWIELLRELKRLGLSHNPSPQVVANLADPGFVYGLASSHPVLGLDASLLDEPLRNQLLRSDDYHFRLLSDLSALRECPAAHSEDISTREVQRAIGSIESAISLSFENRNRLLGAVDSYVRLLATSNRIDLVAEAGSVQPTQRSTPLVETLLERVSQVLVALTEAREELANHRMALGPSNEVTSVEAAVNNAHALLADDSRRLVDIVTNRAGNVALSTPAETATLVLAREHLTSIIGQLSTSPGPTSLQYLLRPLREWSTSLAIPQVHSDDETTPSPSELATFETEHTTLVDSILVIAQELKKVSALEPAVIPDEDLPDLAIKTAGRSLQATLAIFRLPEMLEQITAFTSTAHRLSTSSHSSAVVAALLQRVAPFLRLFSNLINRHLSSFLEWHKATLKFAFVLTTVVKELSAEGFCKPAEDDGKEGEASGKTMDGTGMADGTGATNVSKDIEDESQVEGLQGEVDKEEKQDEKEGDDDAVEMSADFEGEMEDRGDGDKEDDEDGDSDTESQPDPEDQIADVDPLDPSSVDEKFWGDEATKDASTGEEVNQETTKSAGESEMAAKDDEAPKPQPKDDPTEASADEKKDNKDELPTGDDGAEMDGDGDEEADGSQEGEGEDEETEGDAVPQDENGERLDERMPEADNLDLPDDIQLDGDEKDEKDGLDLDSDMDDMGGELRRPSFATSDSNTDDHVLPRYGGGRERQQARRARRDGRLEGSRRRRRRCCPRSRSQRRSASRPRGGCTRPRPVPRRHRSR
jgi:midasin